MRCCVKEDFSLINNGIQQYDTSDSRTRIVVSVVVSVIIEDLDCPPVSEGKDGHGRRSLYLPLLF